ncbi:TATA element modulatory factor [Drosophila tropicalis]|uniref:TATA element modulatory factor n=1 Tax=Drosophila tropicalis TaxID=46794 RepID=UPI0035AC2887
MSWFEKAKTVIIEALDIQDDDNSNNSNKPLPTSADTAPIEGEDVARGNGSGSGLTTTSKTIAGGVLTGANEGMSLTDASPTFYDNPHANEMVTIAPKASDSGAGTGGPAHTMTKRQSATSDSIDLLSSPSGGSEGEHVPVGVSAGLGKRPSESSLELITATTASEMEMSPDTEPSLPDSIVIIASNETSSDNDDDDDCGQLEGHNLNDSTKTMKALVFSDTQMAANVAMSTGADSDSTHSFEDIQMQMQLSQKSKGEFELEQAGQAVQQNQQQPSSKSADVVDQSYSSTSSDIEIISNPNGGDSSTNSTTTRTSPQKFKELGNGPNAGNKSSSCSSSVMMLKPKGHHREPSEISLLSQDSQTEELDKLVKRISELNQVIEVREQRLLQSERQNSELLERNQELLAQLEMANNRANNPDATEAVQRLSALEKKFQTSIRERDALRIQIKTLKDELLNKIPKDELTECNDMIAGLQSEGEKLSKEILQQSIIIKKLRAKEKTSDTLLKKNGEQISLLSSESERLKRSLAAKEEMERTQIEAVFKMTSEKRRVDDENAEQRSRIEDLQSKLSAVESSFDALKGDLQKRTRLEQDNLKSENQEYLQQINDLREKLRLTEHNLAKREHQLRDENRQLMQRLEMAELRAESSTQELSVTTTPLIRQIESLQKTLNQRSESWQKEEQHLIQRLEDSQIQLRSLQQLESVQDEKQELMRARCNLLEEKLSNALLQAETAKNSLRQQLEKEHSIKEDDHLRQLATLRDELSLQMTKNEQLEQHINQQQEEIRISAEQQRQQMLEATPASTSLLTVEAVKAATAQQQKSHPRCSPPLSLADDSGGSNEEATLGGGILDWQADDLDCGSNSGRQNSGIVQGVHLSFLSANTTTLEHLQALLKQRDGELTHLQWELSRLQAERGVLDGEISTLTIELEMLKEKLIPYEAMEKCYEDLQHRYDALLQMYGEKVERTEELELDLTELKQAYKLQIDELLAAPPPNLKRPGKQT